MDIYQCNCNYDNEIKELLANYICPKCKSLVRLIMLENGCVLSLKDYISFKNSSFDMTTEQMKTKELIDIKETLVELWDFFTSNTDGDETGLVEEIQDKYSNSLNAVRRELNNKYVRSEAMKLVRKYNKENSIISNNNTSMMIGLNTFSNEKISFLIDDISTWNGMRNGFVYSFSIEKFSEKDFSEQDAQNLETFINDEPNNNFADQFNLEYMSYLTGHFKGTKEELINLINSFFNQL